MTIEHCIDTIAAWLRENVAPKVQLKKSPDRGRKQSTGYDYKLVNPSVVTMFLPPDETMRKLNEESKEDDRFPDAPSIMVQFIGGEHDCTAQNGSSDIRLVLSVWNPGVHQAHSFQPTAEGWRDLASLIETTVQELETSIILNGVRMRPDTLRYSFATDNGLLMDHYPFFIGLVEFTVDFNRLTKPAWAGDIL